MTDRQARSLGPSLPTSGRRHGARRTAAIRGLATAAREVDHGCSPIGRSTMSEQTTNALPIVLIHGLWMTARSWDRWAAHYRAKGHQVVVPAYPGFEIEVEALR